MKKIVILMMCMLLLLSSAVLVSCDDSREDESDTATDEPTSVETVEGGGVKTDDINGKSAYDAYAAMMEGSEDWDNFEAKIMQKSSGQYGESKIVSTTNIVLKLDGQRAYMKLESPDTPYINSELWYVDGYLYQSSNEDKYKEELSFEDFMFGLGSDYMPEDVELTEKYFEKAVIVKYDDGSFGIRIDVTELYSEELAEEMLEIGEITECEMELLIGSDGSYKGMHITMTMNMDMDGMTVTTVSESLLEFTNVGATVVEGPGNPDEFEEFDWGFDDEIPDMTDWTDEEIESRYDAYFGLDE